MRIDTDRVRAEREHRAWSQEHLAHVAGIGLRTVQRIESSGMASLDSAAALASAFDLPVHALAAPSNPRIKPPNRRQVVSGFAVVCSLAMALFFARGALAEQFHLDVGANINEGEQIDQKVTADEGKSVEIQFDDQLKAVITPGLVDVNGSKMVSLSLQILERREDGRYTLLESPDMVHDNGGKWEIRLGGTPTGNAYRLVVSAHRQAG
jgi:transcriptional regulator with XRE-family HTH domain